MSNLLARTAAFWLSPIGTFALTALVPLLIGKRGIAMVVPLLLPLWVASSVAWSENEESYRFLRTLPITDRTIVQVKFGVALGALLVYALVLTLIGLAAFGATDGFVLQLKLLAACCAGTLLLAAIGYIGAWRIGRRVLPGLVAVVTPVALLGLLLIKEFKRTPWTDVQDLALFRLLDAVPLLFYGLAAAAALAAFWGLLQLGIRVKESSEASL